VTPEEAAEHQGEHVTWHGWGNRIEDGTIDRIAAGLVLVRRAGNGVPAAVAPELLNLTSDTDRLF
jgi:hypothetical protein